MASRPLGVVIVDDEELARALVKEYLASHPDVTVLAECANGFEAVKSVAETKPDVLFLDVQMPRLDGFEVLELIERDAEGRPAVVFTTAYDRYALRALTRTPSTISSSRSTARGSIRRSRGRAPGSAPAPRLLPDLSARDRSRASSSRTARP